MTRMSILAAAILSCAVAAPAQAFHPFQQNYGYVPPKKQKRSSQRAERAPQPLFGMGWDWDRPQNSGRDDEDDDNARSSASEGTLTGGGRPNISAVAPPKVSFPNSYAPGSIVIDTAGRRLYYVLSSTTAYRYPIAVGKQGFAWSGVEKISRKVAWPDWYPPAEMRARKPGLPVHMQGGVRNPLGAMALYLGSTLYRIHGTNDVSSIGTATSSGCIRMTNGNVTHLASIAGVGTTVHVLKRLPAGLARVAKAGSEG
ncbi:ErfK/YbiS/YcfS/YnhG family protein [Hyphomicrobium denitrificans ATCC 51888]|uniref:ErfK/YbiS/YcfS/YnhG family protein n=2 Tax=Hyphomicrobium denitrificans TaxID=53399 RepID=D8JPQ9_HYPDA|nr:ErfK/YbiS/YcfS/YnhG family protein [Hyphomicrobium denitrificans ATCC 51888]